MTTVKQRNYLNNVLMQANQLCDKHDTYVTQFVTRANEELYILLAGIMLVCEEIWSSDCEDYIVKNLRKEMRDKWQIKTQKNSTVTALVVRYITRGTRQLIYNYAKVIDNAKEAGISAQELTGYIKSKGGIDAVRKKAVDAETKRELAQQTKQMQANLTKHLTSNKNIGTVNLTNNNRKTIEAGCYDVKFNVLLTVEADGEERVVTSMYPSRFIVDYCLALHKICCEAAYANKSNKGFSQFCKENELNMDVILRWMRDNDIRTKEDAVNELQHIYGYIADAEASNVIAANEQYALTA